MNYYAPTRNLPQTKTKVETISFWQMAVLVLDAFKNLYAFIIELPLNILGNMGIFNIPSWLSMGPGLCSLCICGAFMAVGTSVSVGLGVGLGVGLSCALSNNTVTSNSTANDTSTSNETITAFSSGSTSVNG